MTPRSQLEKDLEKKLLDDLERAVSHFGDMCDTAEISTANQVASVMSLLGRLLVTMAIELKMPKEAFIAIIGFQWEGGERHNLKNK